MAMQLVREHRIRKRVALYVLYFMVLSRALLQRHGCPHLLCTIFTCSVQYSPAVYCTHLQCTVLSCSVQYSPTVKCIVLSCSVQYSPAVHQHGAGSRVGHVGPHRGHEIEQHGRLFRTSVVGPPHEVEVLDHPALVALPTNPGLSA